MLTSRLGRPFCCSLWAGGRWAGRTEVTLLLRVCPGRRAGPRVAACFFVCRRAPTAGGRRPEPVSLSQLEI